MRPADSRQGGHLRPTQNEEGMREIHFSLKILKNYLSATFRRSAFALCAASTLSCPTGSAQAESAYCNDLKAQIARADSGASQRYRSAAGKQTSELNRAIDYAHRLGCDRQQFLFFGDSPPAQCVQINARVAQMRANLGALQQQSAGDTGLKQSLLARYDSECRDRPVVTPTRAGPRNFFEELFGVAPPQQANPHLREVPLEDSNSDSMHNLEGQPDEEVFEDGHPTGGSEAVCVRQCDGGFFPVSYSARQNNLDDLNTLCKALCPGAEATLYTKSPWKDIDTAVSINGESYSEHPNALKFQKTRDASCGCKPPDKSWAEALVEAERILAASNSKDSVVTAEQAEQLSRPVTAGAAHGARSQSTRREVQTTNAGAGTLAPPPPASSPVPGGEAQGVTREVVGPDGVKRRVRVVAPTL